MPEYSYLKELSHRLAECIMDAYPEFDGYRVRADAGEPGSIYVALREAREQAATAERLTTALGPLLEQQLLGEARQVAFAISAGSGERDLLLLVELRLID
jgi:hypothetical protein